MRANENAWRGVYLGPRLRSAEDRESFEQVRQLNRTCRNASSGRVRRGAGMNIQAAIIYIPMNRYRRQRQRCQRQTIESLTPPENKAKVKSERRGASKGQ